MSKKVRGNPANEPATEPKPIVLITPEELASLDVTEDRSTWNLDDWNNYETLIHNKKQRIATTATDGGDELYAFEMAAMAQGKLDEVHFNNAHARSLARRGRPKSDRDDITVKIDRQLGKLAQHVATDRNISIAEYLSGVIRDTVTQDANDVFRKLLEGK